MGKPGPLDGDLNQPFWQTGEWMDTFYDIEGDPQPRPWKHTRVKVLWDAEALLGEEAAKWGVKTYVTPSMFEGVLEWNGTVYHIDQSGYLWAGELF